MGDEARAVADIFQRAACTRHLDGDLCGRQTRLTGWTGYAHRHAVVVDASEANTGCVCWGVGRNSENGFTGHMR